MGARGACIRVPSSHPVHTTQMSDDRPSPYQMGILRAAGSRIRPHSYASAQTRIDRLEPSPGQVELLTSINQPVPSSRKAASEAITAYELAHPEWAAARRADRSAKGVATRREREQSGRQTQYNDTLKAYHKAGVERFGTAAASEARLNFLRGLALKLPANSDERIATFIAMRGGLTASDAGSRIEALKAGT